MYSSRPCPFEFDKQFFLCENGLNNQGAQKCIQKSEILEKPKQDSCPT